MYSPSLVISGLLEYVLIGTDVLPEFGLIIDTKLMTVSRKDKRVIQNVCEYRSVRGRRLGLENRCVVPPRSMVRTVMYVCGGTDYIGQSVMECNEKRCVEVGVEVPRMLVNVMDSKVEVVVLMLLRMKWF